MLSTERKRKNEKIATPQHASNKRQRGSSFIIESVEMPIQLFLSRWTENIPDWDVDYIELIL